MGVEKGWDMSNVRRERSPVFKAKVAPDAVKGHVRWIIPMPGQTMNFQP